MLVAALAVAVLAAGCEAGTTLDPSPPTPEAGSASPDTAEVQVTLGHCFVEPVAFDGELWNVPFRKQFGWGGLAPQGWVGTGVMMRADEDTVRFEDDGGAVVVFRPVEHPSVNRVENAPCD
ncbi:MAG: hypothetical protein ACRDO4_07040 [Nocardioides sp.]